MANKNYNCNRCDRASCQGDYHRGKKATVYVGCPGQVQPAPMRMTLLEAAVDNQGSMNALGVILQNLNMKFIQTEKYPFFDFHLGPEPVR